MVTKTSKKIKTAQELYEKNKSYSLEEAIDILQKMPRAKFDETVELSMNLGLNPKDASQIVRGSASLPHGTGKKIRVIVFCADDNISKAKEAGAEHAGSEELIKKVSGGWTDFDVAIATTAMMKEIAKLGRVLGPRGLMPNPKTGTVTDDVEKTIKEVKAGKIEFKMDKQGGLHAGVGKISFSKDALCANIKQLINAIFASNPNMNKPQSVRSIVITKTMGPGIRVDISYFKK